MWQKLTNNSLYVKTKINIVDNRLINTLEITPLHEDS